MTGDRPTPRQVDVQAIEHALVQLAATGPIAQVLPLVAHPSARIRLAALRAIITRAPDHAGAVVPLLRDDEVVGTGDGGCVPTLQPLCEVAFELLARAATHPAAFAILDDALADTTLGERRFVYLIVSRGGRAPRPWSAVTLALEALGSEDEDLRDDAAGALGMAAPAALIDELAVSTDERQRTAAATARNYLARRPLGEEGVGRIAPRHVEQDAAGFFPFQAMSADDYAARWGDGMLSFSFGDWRYRDAQLDRWIRRLAALLRTPGG